MQIEKITIKNFKGIESYTGEVNGKNIYLIGPNAANKTSFIDAIWAGLEGPKYMPSEPITKGKPSGLIEIDLGEFIARTKLKQGKKIGFELENKNPLNDSDKFIKSPRSYLKNRLGIIDFDIMDFFNKTDSEKLQYLSKVLNTDFSNFDADIEEEMENRKFSKKKLAELSSKVDYYNAEDAEKEEINIVELSNEIQDLNAKKTLFDSQSVKIKEAKELYDTKKKELEDLFSKICKGDLWLKNNAPDIEKLEDLNKKLSTANETNKNIEKAKELKSIDDEVVLLEKEIAESTESIDKLRLEKSEAISKSIKIPGLTYDTEKSMFLYKGLPFERNQTNTASQLIAGLHIASHLLKDLKIAKVDASLIDTKNFNEVLKWAKSEGIELFIELVDRDATKLTIDVVD